jgi:hypothetical protein
MQIVRKAMVRDYQGEGSLLQKEFHNKRGRRERIGNPALSVTIYALSDRLNINLTRITEQDNDGVTITQWRSVPTTIN